MRVIAGQHRSRILKSPPGLETRPTSDRLRETLFNILAPRLGGCRFVDLYAGTGAVGIEALSRGASFCWFAEKAAPALKVLRANLASLNITQGFAIEDRGTGALLQRLAKLSSQTSSQIDIIFLDPPYDAETEYEATLHFLGSAAGRSLLADHAVVMAEHASKAKFHLQDRYGGLVRVRQHKQGEAAVSFYEAVPE